MNLLDLPARDDERRFHVVVESPRGARMKLKFDPRLGAFGISRPLNLGLRYPFDWGFVPSTRAPDGDPLDALVLSDAGTYPGVVYACRALGVLQVSQNSEQHRGRERNDRVIAVPVRAPRADGVTDARQLGSRVRAELEQFFLAVQKLTEKNAEIVGWDGPEAADALIDRCVAAYAP
jgi:inorganic pyrophosphatase